MNEKIFDIKNFNVISDDEYYYVFRALNNADHKDIENGITTDSNGIQRIRTDRERWEELNGRGARFSSDSKISLEEVWSHIRKNYNRETNCISLSSNANVSIDYGKAYNEEYVMVRIPKSKDDKTVFAGQYMLEELSKEIADIVENLPEDSDVQSIINDIESNNSPEDIKNIADTLFKKAKSEGKYIGTNTKLDIRMSIRDRFSRKQYFSDEQQREYNKIIAKLTVLELYGKVKNILPTTRDNTSLISTIGMAFSSGELVHYKDIDKSEFVELSKEMMDVISLVQQTKNSSIDSEKIHEFEKKLIEYVNNNGRLEIDSKGKSIDFQNLTVEDVYKITGGRIDYEKARRAIALAFKLSQSRLQTLEYSTAIKELFSPNGEFEEIISYIEKRGFVIDSDIITRENDQGIQIAESVNVGTDKNTRRIISSTEQQKIIDRALSLSKEELQTFSANNLDQLYINFIENLLDKNEEKTENTYFAEAIVDSLDFSKIYKNAISSQRETIQDSEREILVRKLESADCKKLYNSFRNAGVNHNEIAGYVINLLVNDGYKGYNFDELSRAEDLDEIISINIKNGMLKNKIIPFRLDELLENRDDSNVVEGTNIRLRDYQKETVDNLEEIYKDKRFAGVVLPTGGGKSFVAITEMLKNRDKNILYFAPQTEILSQIQRHILKNVLGLQVLTKKEIEELDGKNPPEGKIYPKDIDEYISKAFPHLKMYCYQSLSERDEESKEKKLRKILSNSDADLMIFDELHRAGAETWEPLIQELINKNKNSKILGITATPIRDADKKDMMETLAKFSGDYSQEELINGEYLAKEMYLIDAIQDFLVVEPKIVGFNYYLAESAEYKEVKRMYKAEKNETKKARLKKILDQMDLIINDTSDIQSMILNEADPNKKRELEEKFSEMRKEIKKENTQGIGDVIRANIVKKDGRYIVFLPQNNTGLPTEEYVLKEIEKVKEYLKDIDSEPEVEYLLSEKSKKDNLDAISNFEDSDSEHLKLLFAIDKLNEGVHIDGINGEIMLRKIGEGSRILYLQQLGRVIFSLDPDNPIPEEELPIVFDVYNNYIAQNMNREINKKNSTSDLQRLQSIVNWINRHGYFPDINSEILNEARKAISLKRIQIKYGKYLDGINNDKLSQKEIHETEQILKLATSIDLFERDIPDRIIPPGEKDLSEVQLFKVTGSQKRFLELFKEATKTTQTQKTNHSFRIRTALNVLATLNDYGLDINNETILEESTIEDILGSMPDNIRSRALEELDVDLDYKIGEEYNMTKAAFVDNTKNAVFLDYDVRDLRRYGIFENTDIKYFGFKKVPVLDGDFIIAGKRAFRKLNIKTGTYYDEDGCSFSGCNEKNFDREGFFWIINENGRLSRTSQKHNYDGFDKKDIHINGTSWDDRGFDVNGNHKETGKPYDKRHFGKDGKWLDIKEDGSCVETNSSYNPEGWDVNGNNKKTGSIYDEYDFTEDKKSKDTNKIYNQRMLTRDGKYVIVDEKTGEVVITDRPYDDRQFTLDGRWVDVKEDGSYVITDKRYNPARWDANGNYVDVDARTGQDIFTERPYNKGHLTEAGRWVNVRENGTYEITDILNEQGMVTSTGVLITHVDVNEETGEEIKYTNKAVADFVNSGMSKRGYCQYDGLKIRQLNELLEIEKQSNPEIADIVNAADIRAPHLEKELKPRVKTLAREIAIGKIQLEQMKSQGISRKTLNTKINEINLKIREKRELEIKIATQERENALKENEAAKQKNEEARKLASKYQTIVDEKKGKIPENE